jgi:hypothetical protein
MPRPGDHDLARRGNEHVGSVKDTAWIIGVAQHVERS